jgi:hypothetical protein
MVYYGKGFSWTELYNLPSWLRKFYFKKMEEALKAEAKAADESNKRVKNSQAGITKPNIPRVPRK